ncbi:uncharacterized protein [Syngnathus scovelli]|uniref:uncharacterized protein n=1 Tax=Syngnathus scovelli TaxID=161590 RepID=UPI0035CC5965
MREATKTLQDYGQYYYYNYGVCSCLYTNYNLAWGKAVNGDLDIIKLVKETHEGKYEAKDSTTPSTVYKTITLDITEPQVKLQAEENNPTKNKTEIGQSSHQVQVKASSSGIPKIGAELTLDCLVTKNGAPATGVTTFVWLKNGDVMHDHTGATVVFKALMKMDAGTYACKVGTAQSTGYVLTLTGGAVAASYSPALLLTLSLLHALLCLLCY